MEKRVILATVISMLFFAAYANVVGKRYKSQAQLQQQSQPLQAEDVAEPDETTQAVLTNDVGDDFLDPVDPEAPQITLASNTLEVGFSKATGEIVRVAIKGFNADHGEGPLVLGGEHALDRVTVGTAPNRWELRGHSGNAVSFTVYDADEKEYTVTYGLDPEQPVVTLRIDGMGAPVLPVQIAAAVNETYEGRSRYVRMMISALTFDEGGGKGKYKKYYAPIKAARDVPRGTSLLAVAGNYFCQAIDFGDVHAAVGLLPSRDRIAATSAALLAPKGYSAKIYFGPRDYFYMKRAGFEKAFKIGLVGKVGLLLLAVLSWIAGLTHNYGIAIVILAAGVSLILAPFTMMSYRSMAKMQQIQPLMNKIMEKHKENPTKLNQELFALYKEHKVSPLSGCLPMLLQLPIFIALFQAISHFIELRGESFLWIKDLSLPDRLAQMPFTLPMLGSDVNLLPILMAVAMVIQTRINKPAASAASDNPAAKMMSGPVMPVIFTLLFYNFPSGLVLYYLMNSLISTSMYRLVKR